MTKIAIVWGRKPRRRPSAAEIIERARTGGSDALLATPGVTPPWRLNTDRGRRYGPDRLAQAPDTAGKLAALKAEVGRDLDLFARGHHRFLDRYFAFIASRVAEHAATIDAMFAWSAGLFRAEDAVFSALAPLPYASFVAPSGDAAACDFAFWTGGELIAVSLGPGSVSHVGDNVRRIALLPPDLTDEGRLFTASRFPSALLSFWKNDPVPSVPFRPAGLREGVDS